ncbi:CZB domain-containing protein [Azovibrio restrictus]|uniref:CZB domain-containing protein n=1 Tax=Azovibrio restrictus TaxID=146938 RepID=UPI0026EF9082|nr:CZB domain-containing protein [Azovibrio restrictus]MDD3481499.1 CZB domain-containing protein [Azovibrio restrictus]
MDFEPDALVQQALEQGLEVLTLQVGRQRVGVPMAEVVHILDAVQARPAREGGGSEGDDVIAYEGQALAFLPLWSRLGEQALSQEYIQLVETLRARRQDHLDWMGALSQSLTQDVPFTKARNPRECAFGKWYHGFVTENRRLRLLLLQFDTPHRRIHALADQLLELKAAGRLDEALVIYQEEVGSTLATLLSLFDRAVETLVQIRREVAVIVRRQGVLYALGADAVQDIRRYDAETVSCNAALLQRYRVPTRCFLIEAGASPLPVLDWPRLTGVITAPKGD